MRTGLRSVALLIPLLLLSSPSGSRAAEPSQFPLRDGDLWVMVGDSITAQHLHSNYFEAFCYARYPNMKFAFRNSGVGGDTIPKAIARFDWDAAPWKPTVVSVELGMNDKGGFTVDAYMDRMREFIGRVKGIGARPVYLSPSPVNNGDTIVKLDSGNKRLSDYAVALKKHAAEQKAPFADQFHQLVDIWGQNKPNENLLNDLNAVKKMAANDKLIGVEHLRAFLALHESKKHQLVSLLGDPVHPGAPGQLMMAAALLQDLGAKSFVSSATLDANGKVIETKGCEISYSGPHCLDQKSAFLSYSSGELRSPTS
jgi:lysophospholipase L1-like esterase